MNSKGQSLVLFVLIIPLILLVMLSVYKLGTLAILKQELDNINYLVIDYGLDHLEEENIETELNEIIHKNKSDIDISQLNITDNKIFITLKAKKSSLEIKSSYVGYIADNKKIIEKNK